MGDVGIVMGLEGRFLPVSTESRIELLSMRRLAGPPLAVGTDDDKGACAGEEGVVEEDVDEEVVMFLLEAAARVDFLTKLGNCEMGYQIVTRKA